MFPHRTASATKLRPQTGQKNRSGKRPALLLRTLLLAALLLHFNAALCITYVVKAAPVFVSDVTLPDVDITLNAMAASSSGCLLSSCSSLALQWIASTL